MNVYFPQKLYVYPLYSATYTQSFSIACAIVSSICPFSFGKSLIYIFVKNGKIASTLAQNILPTGNTIWLIGSIIPIPCFIYFTPTMHILVLLLDYLQKKEFLCQYIILYPENYYLLQCYH